MLKIPPGTGNELREKIIRIPVCGRKVGILDIWVQRLEPPGLGILPKMGKSQHEQVIKRTAAGKLRNELFKILFFGQKQRADFDSGAALVLRNESQD